MALCSGVISGTLGTICMAEELKMVGLFLFDTMQAPNLLYYLFGLSIHLNEQIHSNLENSYKLRLVIFLAYIALFLLSSAYSDID